MRTSLHLIVAGIGLALFNASSVFLHAQDYRYTTNRGTITILEYTGPGDAVIIPDTIHGLPVTCIGDGSFRERPVTSITIPASVTAIGKMAFYECRELIHLTMGNSVTNIGDNAFYSCTGLTN